MINAKILRDGERVVISFEGIEDAELFLQKVVEIVSNISDTEIPVIDVPDLEPPNAEVDLELFAEEREPEIAEFAEPFTGMTPAEIVNASRFEGFYYLCRAIRANELPEQYAEEVKSLVLNFFNTKSVLVPPFGNIERMQKYLKMAQNILGTDRVPDVACELDDASWLDTACETALAELQKFCENYL